jgi:hypothetical protein
MLVSSSDIMVKALHRNTLLDRHMGGMEVKSVVSFKAPAAAPMRKKTCGTQW